MEPLRVHTLSKRAHSAARVRLVRPPVEKELETGRIYVDSEIACTNGLTVSVEIIPLTEGSVATYRHSRVPCVDGVATVDVDIPGIELRSNFRPNRYQVEMIATDNQTQLSTRSQSGYFVRLNRSRFHPQDERGWVQFGGQI